MSEIKISIITSIYNNAPYLEKCLDSFVNQTLKEIEIIIVNDGSTDNSEEICKRYTNDTRIKYFSKKNNGKSSAINYGYKESSGKYILILDSDDYIEPKLCEITYKLAEKLELDIVNYGYIYEQHNTSNKRHSVFPKNKVLNNNDIKSVIKKNTYNSKILWFTWTNLIKKELLDNHNILHNENLKVGVDSTFNLECYLSANKMYSITDLFYHYVYNPLSVTQKKFKTDLPSKIENQFNARLSLYNKYHLDDNFSKIDFSRYYIQHSLFFILSNELNYEKGFKIDRIKKIRDLKMFEYCFKYFKPSKDCPLKKKIAIWCFKNRIYFPLKKLVQQ